MIDLERLLAAGALPESVGVCAITVAELTAGPAATGDPAVRARRQDRLQRVEATFEPIPFGLAASRAYGLVFSAVRSRGRGRRRRMAGLLIASVAVAVAEGLPLVTRNPDDFIGLEEFLTVVPV